MSMFVLHGVELAYQCYAKVKTGSSPCTRVGKGPGLTRQDPSFQCAVGLDVLLDGGDPPRHGGGEGFGRGVDT